MGRHADAGRSRGVARWVMTAAVVVVIVVAAAVGYLVIVNRSDSAATGACDGSVTLAVAAGPNASAAVTAAAASYNATKPVARSACVTAKVTSVADSQALTGLTGRWPSGAGHAPGLWIPDNSAALAALDVAKPGRAAGHPTEPIAWSPVVLAVRSDDAPSLASLAWSNLPDAAGPQGTATLAGSRHLTLALPPIDANPATSYALQSVLAGPERTAALNQSEVRDAADTLRDIGAGAVAADSTGEALAALASNDGRATAVPVVEASLVAFDTTTSGSTLSAVHPDGPTAGDALIAAPISAPWADQTVAAAASSFQAYLTDGPGQRILADHGWRTPSAHPSDPAPGVDTTASVTRLPAGGPAVDAALASELGQPVPPSPLSTSTSSTPTSTASANGAASSSATTAASTGATASGTETTPGARTSVTAPPTKGTPTSGTETHGTPTSGTPTSGTERTTPTTSSPTVSTTANPAAKGPVLTVIVDSSQDMAQPDDGTSLLGWVKKALPRVMGGKITDRVGLWAFADSVALPPDGYPQLVSTGTLSGTVDGHSRSHALTTAVSDLTASGDRWAYGALIAALKEAPDVAVQGRESRILLITSGVDQTPATPRQMVLDAEDAVHGKVRVDVVGLGDAVPVEAYQDIAKTGGGEYIPVTDPSRLGETLTDLYTLGD